MTTEIQIDGTEFLINGSPTYAGIEDRGRPIQGLLFNSRMVQAIFDDENPETAIHWRYPDTGVWDPDRNTDEFCAALPEYRRHGLLGVTVGLQGGGSIYLPEVYNSYLNSACAPDGSLRTAYFDRLRRVLEAADAAGMVVIVNYFYWRQVSHMEGEAALVMATQAATEWLLGTGYRNILVDVYNEFQVGNGLTQSGRIHELIDLVQQTTLDGQRLLTSSSIMPGKQVSWGRWSDLVDFFLPHGNDSWSAKLRRELREMKASDAYRANPRPIMINEDSMYVTNLEAAIDEYASWGLYIQGFGCGGWDHGRYEWTRHPRETVYEQLSGFQTVPVNWSINTGHKRDFFNRLAEITGSEA